VFNQYFSLENIFDKVQSFGNVELVFEIVFLDWQVVCNTICTCTLTHVIVNRKLICESIQHRSKFVGISVLCNVSE